MDLKGHNVKGKKIYPSICPSVSLYVSSLPLSIAPFDPCALSFSSVFTPTCSHSLVPPSSLFHLPSATEAAAGQNLGRGGKVGLKEGRSVSQLSLNNYHDSFCAPTKE